MASEATNPRTRPTVDFIVTPYREGHHLYHCVAITVNQKMYGILQFWGQSSTLQMSCRSFNDKADLRRGVSVHCVGLRRKLPAQSCRAPRPAVGRPGARSLLSVVLAVILGLATAG